MMAKKNKQKNPDREDQRRSDDAAATDARPDESTLEERIRELEEKVASAEEATLRARADYQNFQRRAMINEREAREWGAAGVLESVVSVIDHFDVALTQDPKKASAESILEGVRMIKGELLRALRDHGVAAIDPKPGQDLDPGRHEAIGHLNAEGVEPGAVSQTTQVGYAIGDRVLRPAKVFVAPEPSESE